MDIELENILNKVNIDIAEYISNFFVFHIAIFDNINLKNTR